jgi:Domain of unknown function (DUF5615)
MRIKLDENLPADLVTALRSLGHDVESVNTEDLSGHPDPDVWNAAQSEGRILITGHSLWRCADVHAGTTRWLRPRSTRHARPSRLDREAPRDLCHRGRRVVARVLCRGE